MSVYFFMSMSTRISFRYMCWLTNYSNFYFKCYHKTFTLSSVLKEYANICVFTPLNIEGLVG